MTKFSTTPPFTVEFVLRSSIDYNYTTINNFDENIDDSLATLDNIAIMTINTTNDDISFATLNDDDYYSLQPHSTALRSAIL